MLFQQLSEDIFLKALPQLLALLHRPSLLDSVKYVGPLLAAATWAYPTATLSRALPACFAALLTKTKPSTTTKPPADTGPAVAAEDEEASIGLQPLSESELRWWLTILSHLV